MIRTVALPLLAALSIATPALAQQASPRWQAGGSGGSAHQPLKAGDMVRLGFWLDQDLSGDYVIDESGEVVLPLIGIRPAAGIRPLDLKGRLRRDYDEILKNQDVQILFLRRIRVLGEVKRAGLYHAELGMTVGDLIAMAEGVQEFGDVEGVNLIRGGALVASDLDPTLLVGPNLQSGDQIYVPQKGWFNRNSNLVVGTAASITVALIYRGFFNN